MKQAWHNMATMTTMMTTTSTVAPRRVTVEQSHSRGSPDNGHPARPPPTQYKTLDGLLRSHASEEDDIPLVGYPAKGVDDYEIHTAKALDRYVDAACWWYQQQGLKPADSSLEKAPVCAFLTASCLEAIVTFFALNRMGWAVLFLSTRLSGPAYISLMDMADANMMIATPNYASVIKEIQSVRQCQFIPRINGEDYRINKPTTKYRREVNTEVEAKKIAWIIHSSGSTGFPKPIFLSNYATLANWRKGLGLRSFTVSPLFHSHALMEFGRAFYAKATIFMGNYALPVTRQNLIAAMRVAAPEMICAVPYVLKLLGETEDGIQELAKAKVVMYGGSACPDALGDELVSKGVNLAGNYGATETGFIMNSFRPWEDKEWSYLRLFSPAADYTLMDEISPGVFECVALDGLPSKGPSNSDNPANSFRTRDLFTRHPDPSKSNYWKYLSRLDDRLTLVNGEKVLPIPIEGRIRQHELVQEAAVFGAGMSVPGVLIFPGSRANTMTDEDFLDTIWPTVEAANASAETFSHIPKDLVVVMPRETTYPKTDKGTFIRAQMYEQFKDCIQAAYTRFEGDQEGGSLVLGEPELQEWLLAKFDTEIDVQLEGVNSDIFGAGVDSLQTTRMWNVIKKQLDLGGRQSQMSQNIIFEKGTVSTLAKYLYNLRLGIQDQEEEEAEVVLMQNLIEKYSNFEPHKSVGLPDAPGNVVLITGTTGGLGSILLANALRRNDVSKVWTLVRARTAEGARRRVLEALLQRQLELSDEQLTKLVCFPGDFGKANLGLDEEHYEQLVSSLTHVIHSAWAVNFNLPTKSFEAQHICGVHNLINTCLKTKHSRPASFYFCSSVSTASGTPKPATIQERPVDDLRHSQSMGYGRSKLISEHITRNAARDTGMTSRVLRIGQLAGDSVTAVWNETEAISLMIRSALTTGSLPKLSESPSWLPIDKAAETIEELVFCPAGLHGQDGQNNVATEDSELVYHVLNPKTFNWSENLLPMLRQTSLPTFDIVEPGEWLERLKNSDPNPESNPSIKLVDFWTMKYGSSDNDSAQTILKDEETKGLTFETKRTTAESRVLAGVSDPVSDGLMLRIVNNWVQRWQ